MFSDPTRRSKSLVRLFRDHVAPEVRLQYLMKRINSVPLLMGLNTRERIALAKVLEMRHFKEGDKIIVQSAPAGEMFIIESGNAVARINGEKICEYHEGGYFGERGLIVNQPRAATVRAFHGKVSCWTLRREDFERVVGKLKEREPTRLELSHLDASKLKPGRRPKMGIWWQRTKKAPSDDASVAAPGGALARQDPLIYKDEFPTTVVAMLHATALLGANELFKSNALALPTKDEKSGQEWENLIKPLKETMDAAIKEFNFAALDPICVSLFDSLTRKKRPTTIELNVVAESRNVKDEHAFDEQAVSTMLGVDHARNRQDPGVSMGAGVDAFISLFNGSSEVNVTRSVLDVSQRVLVRFIEIATEFMTTPDFQKLVMSIDPYKMSKFEQQQGDPFKDTALRLWTKISRNGPSDDLDLNDSEFNDILGDLVEACNALQRDLLGALHDGITTLSGCASRKQTHQRHHNIRHSNTMRKLQINVFSKDSIADVKRSILQKLCDQKLYDDDVDTEPSPVRLKVSANVDDTLVSCWLRAPLLPGPA